jgi:hypothetical protein
MEWYIEYVIPLFFILLFGFFFAYKKITGNPDALTGKHKEEKSYSKSIENLDDLIRRALMKAGFSKVGYNDDFKMFYASAGFSFWSYGEDITVKITEHTVHFSSVCILPVQVLSWGKNKRNSTKFFKELDALTT